MKVVIIGSFRKFFKEITEITSFFKNNGYSVLFPKITIPLDSNTDFVFLETDHLTHVKEIEDGVLRKINSCDFVYLVNPNGYVGASATFEIGYANAINKPVYALELPKDATIQYYITKITKPYELEKKHESFHLIFDADDTLWESQKPLQNAELKIENLINEKHKIKSNFQNNFINTEKENIPKIGYGSHSYFLSLAETFFKTNAYYELKGDFLQICADLAKKYIKSPPALFDNVKQTLRLLKQRKYIIHLLSRGAKHEQLNKFKLSGLTEFFDSVTICETKTAEEYKNFIKALNIDPKKACMIGNSIKSDITPALKANLGAIYIPSSIHWALEKDEINNTTPRYVQIEKFTELQEILKGDNII